MLTLRCMAMENDGTWQKGCLRKT